MVRATTRVLLDNRRPPPQEGRRIASGVDSEGSERAAGGGLEGLCFPRWKKGKLEDQFKGSPETVHACDYGDNVLD